MLTNVDPMTYNQGCSAKKKVWERI